MKNKLSRNQLRKIISEQVDNSLSESLYDLFGREKWKKVSKISTRKKIAKMLKHSSADSYKGTPSQNNELERLIKAYDGGVDAILKSLDSAPGPAAAAEPQAADKAVVPEPEAKDGEGKGTDAKKPETKPDSKPAVKTDPKPYEYDSDRHHFWDEGHAGAPNPHWHPGHPKANGDIQVTIWPKSDRVERKTKQKLSGTPEGNQSRGVYVPMFNPIISDSLSDIKRITGRNVRAGNGFKESPHGAGDHLKYEHYTLNFVLESGDIITKEMLDECGEVVAMNFEKAIKPRIPGKNYTSSVRFFNSKGWRPPANESASRKVTRLTKSGIRNIISEQIDSKVHSIAVSTRTRGQHDRSGWTSGIYEDDNPCWDGYSPGAQSGTKTKTGKSGKRVPNCEDIIEDGSNEGECPTSGCVVHRGDKWRVMSNKDGSLWDAEYDTKKDADSGLRAYHASR